MINSMNYQLKFPYEVKSSDGSVIASYKEFNLSRPKGRHLKATDRVVGEAAKTLALIASCIGVPPEMLDDLDIVDFTVLGEIIEGFSKAPRRTGETSSAT